MTPNSKPPTSGDGLRELAADDLHAALHQHVLAPFLRTAEAGPALTAAAGGEDLTLQCVSCEAEWTATLRGKVIARGELGPAGVSEVGDALTTALAAGLNARPEAEQREVTKRIRGGAVGGASLRIRAAAEVLTFALIDVREEKVIWSAARMTRYDQPQRNNGAAAG